MMFTKLVIGAFSLLMTNVAFAIEITCPGNPDCPPAVQVPLEDGGLFALAAACIAVGIHIVRSKRK